MQTDGYPRYIFVSTLPTQPCMSCQCDSQHHTISMGVVGKFSYFDKNWDSEIVLWSQVTIL